MTDASVNFHGFWVWVDLGHLSHMGMKSQLGCCGRWACKACASSYYPTTATKVGLIRNPHLIMQAIYSFFCSSSSCSLITKVKM